MASKTLKYRSAWLLVIAMVGSAFSSHAAAEESAARRWNELTLESIRNDFARPIVHARNLFHMSAAMFDAWSTFDESTVPWLVDDSIVVKGDLEQARIAAISHAAFTLLNHRFAESPGFLFMQGQYRTLMLDLGLDPDFTDTQGGGPAAPRPPSVPLATSKLKFEVRAIGPRRGVNRAKRPEIVRRHDPRLLHTK